MRKDYLTRSFHTTCIMRARAGALIWLARDKERTHETRSQDVRPDARNGEHVCSCRRPRNSRSGRWTTTYVHPGAEESTLPLLDRSGKVTKVTWW